MAEAKTITLTSDALKALLAEAVSAALSQVKETKIQAAKDGKSERSIKNEMLTVKAFKKAGYGDVKPHEDVKTYNRWLAEGRKVKTGEKSVKVKNLRMFHKSQTEVISSEEKAEALAKMQEAIRKHNDAKKGTEQTATA